MSDVHSKPIEIHETHGGAELIHLCLRVRHAPETCSEVVRCRGLRILERDVLRCPTPHPGRVGVRKFGGIDLELESARLPLLNPFAMDGLEQGIVGRETGAFALPSSAELELELAALEWRQVGFLDGWQGGGWAGGSWGFREPKGGRIDELRLVGDGLGLIDEARRVELKEPGVEALTDVEVDGRRDGATNGEVERGELLARTERPARKSRAW